MTRLFLLSLCFTLAACGVKGNLKRPAQIKIEQEKAREKAGEHGSL